MALNSEVLQALADKAEDLECEVIIQRHHLFSEVIESISIEDAFLQNDDMDYEIDMAKEAAEVEASDNREANSYYYL